MTTPSQKPNFASIATTDSMTSLEILNRLYAIALQICSERDATIVEIGAYRGASTTALASAARTAGQGTVHSIDPHIRNTGIHGGQFSSEDHAIYERRLETLQLQEWVVHHCATSSEVVLGWTKTIDLLWIDGDHSYDAVAHDIKAWTTFLKPGGYLILDDVAPRSEVSEAIRDHLPFSRFRTLEKLGRCLVLQRLDEQRHLYLCGGMQSSGSTLLSMCFLQRDDMDGVYDMPNYLIHQDFSNVLTENIWAKMTIGSFSLSEAVDLYSAQGWKVHPILVVRNELDILTSLKKKWYGVDGCTGDDPPLLIRLRRYREDLLVAERNRWTIVRYEDLTSNPRETLKTCCESLHLPWDEIMVSWGHSIESFAYPSEGSASLRDSIQSGGGIYDAIQSFNQRETPTSSGGHAHADEQSEIIALTDTATLPQDTQQVQPSRYRGTRHQVLHQKLHERNQFISRLHKHIVFGPLLKFWSGLVNPRLRRPE